MKLSVAICICLLFIWGSCAVAFHNLLTLDPRRQRVSPPTAGAVRNHVTLHCNLTDFASSSGFPTSVSLLNRRILLFGLGLSGSFAFGGQGASAALQFGKREKRALFFVNANKNASDSLQGEQTDLNQYALNSELCLLKLLPVKNAVFRGLERSITGLSSLKTATLTDGGPWETASASISDAIDTVDKKRNQFEPVFNPEETTLMQILKGERGEQLVEALRIRLVDLLNATASKNITQTLAIQKNALLALADVGELLVSQFPYNVPTEGKYSFLPRLQGRAKVTFTMRRKKRILGNITIVADGFAAPITAGNFVDLSIRNFYTGLPVKVSRKKVGSDNEFEVASIPILGSFQEGFYDPLTAKLRRVPLEIVRVEQGRGMTPGKVAPQLSYAEEKSIGPVRRWDFSDTPASIQNENSRALLSFDIPGLVALNHPDKNLNGGSSEFFSLQLESLPDSKRHLLDGEYAPFGYIVDGYDLFLSLVPGDAIENTYVDEFGALNLVKLRQSSFSEVVQSSEQDFGEPLTRTAETSADKFTK